MAYTVGLLAVHTTDANSLLDVVAEYYARHNLTLIEERIANRQGAHVNPKKSYTDLHEYQKDAYPAVKAVFHTNFDMYTNLDTNREWTIFAYYPDRALFAGAYMAPHVNRELTQLLSARFNTFAFHYEHMNIVDGYVIRAYEDGALIDVLQANMGTVYHKDGFFTEALTGPHADIQRVVEQYLAKHHLDPEADDINMLYDMTTRRPMYLKGRPDDIVKFFQYQGQLSE